MKPLIINADITEEQADEITLMNDIISMALQEIEEDFKTNKSTKKVISNVLKKTHFVSLMPIIQYITQERIPLEDFESWLISFFNGAKSASNNEEYNQASRQGSSKPENIKKRKDILFSNFLRYIENAYKLAV
jgi:hypothetical protein